MSESPVFWHEPSPEMALASERARETFRYFWRELSWEARRIIPGLGAAAVKIAFWDEEDGPVEHMWLSEVHFDGHEVSATLLNEPNELQSVQAGDRVSVPLERIGDWLYSIGDRAYGAHTVNQLRLEMSEADRAEHDGMWGLDFGDPADVQLIPPGPDGQVDLEADHPMSVNCAPAMQEQLAGDSDLKNFRDEDGWGHLHHAALAGASSCVRVMLAAGCDPGWQTRRGDTPRDLAASLGWTETVVLLDAATS